MQANKLKMRGSEPRLLFVTYGGGHVNMLIPLIRHFLEREDASVSVLALTTARNRLTEEGISSLGAIDFLQEEDRDVLKWGKWLTDQTGPHSLPYNEVVAYLGFCYAELVRQYGEQEAALRYETYGRGAFLPVAFMRRVLQAQRPDVLIATNSPRTERAAFLAARDMDIPRVCVVGPNANRGLDWLAEPGYANPICVMAEYQRQKLMQMGVPEKQVQVTGNPIFDRLVDPGIRIRGCEFRHHLGWRDKKVILWASQKEPAAHPLTGEASDPGIPAKIEHALVSWLPAHADWRLIIRPHPNEDRVVLGLDEKAIYFSEKHEDIAELIAAADVVVTMTSTAGLEASLLGKPVVSPQWSIFSRESYYVEAGIAQPVYSLAEIEGALEAALAGKVPVTANRLIPRAMKATDAIVMLIRERMGVP